MTIKSNVKFDVLENVPFDDPPGVQRGVPSIAFRDVGFHVNIGWPISEEDKIALYERKKVFFFWGKVDYRDAFNKVASLQLSLGEWPNCYRHRRRLHHGSLWDRV